VILGHHDERARAADHVLTHAMATGAISAPALCPRRPRSIRHRARLRPRPSRVG
jgi:hypothetical protein